MVAVLALMMSSPAFAATALSGTYKTTVHSGVFRDAWTITFTKTGYAVTYNGKVVVHGKDTIKGTAMTFTDKSGPYEYKGVGHYTGESPADVRLQGRLKPPRQAADTCGSQIPPLRRRSSACIRAEPARRRRRSGQAGVARLPPGQARARHRSCP